MRIAFMREQFELLARIISGSHHAVCGMGRNARACEWVCHEVAQDQVQHGYTLTIRSASDATGPLTSVGSDAQERPGDAGHVTLGIGPQAGRFWGHARDGEGVWAPVEAIRLLGAGLPILGKPTWGEPLTREDRERWSRTIGALGETTWRRLVAMHYVIVGVGRTGSIVAAELAQLGVQKLTLIDPDRIEAASLGEMALDRQDLGSAKVDAMARSLAAHGWPAEVVPLMVGVTERPALQAIQEADVVFSCVDDSAARIAVTGLATAYLKPLVDIGTGVLGDEEARQMGADIRITLGDCCLCCLGGTSDEEEARARLRRAWPGRRVRQWSEHRAGSLRALNQLAVGIALQLWVRAIAGTAASAWVHAELSTDGQVITQHAVPEETTSVGCPMCRLRGLGDDAMMWV